MSIENCEERLERAENWVKNGLGKVQQTMKVKDGQGNLYSITLLQIYGEWMDFLVKNNFNNKEDNLLKKWKRFLLERNSDAITDLLTGFFEAKRRYGRDQQRGEDKRNWHALCKNYCEKWGRNSDEDLVYSFFSSYSAAERRIRRKVKEGRILGDTSLSLLKSLSLAKEELNRKEEEKEKKAEEKARKEEEKRLKKEERAKNAEKYKLKKTKEKPDKNVEKFVGFEEDSEYEGEVDPDYPKAPEGWSGPTAPGFEGTSYQLDSGDSTNPKEWKSSKNKKVSTLYKNDKGQTVDNQGQLLFDFDDYDD